MALTDHARNRPMPASLAAARTRGDAGAPTARPPEAWEWDAMADDDPHGMPTQRRAWVDLVTRTSGLTDLTTLYTFPDGRRLLLPLVGRRWSTGGIAVAGSMPSGWGFGGVLVDETVTPDNLGHVWRELTSEPAARMARLERRRPLDPVRERSRTWIYRQWRRRRARQAGAGAVP